MKNINIFSYFGRLSIHLKAFNAIWAVKGPGPLMNIAKALFILCGLQLSKSRVRTLYFMVQFFGRIYRSSGPKGLTLYLKACSITLQQALGGHIVKDVAKAGKCRISRNNQGLPRVIPKELRARIRAEHYLVAKFMLSIFALHRAITYLGSPSLSTITQPFSGRDNALEEVKAYLPAFINSFVRSKGFDHATIMKILQKNCKIFPIFKSAPGMVKEAVITWNTGSKSIALGNNFSSAPLNILQSMLSLRLHYPQLWQCIISINAYFDNEQLRVLLASLEYYGLTNRFEIGGVSGPLASRQIGKLRAKEEAAGKVRIFAMVDPLTQWCLYPLHMLIFSIVSKWPMDGTFNQTAPLKRMRFGSESGLYSVDLTAATDRLPLPVQIALLALLLDNEELAQDWAKLLVGRKYSFRQLGYEKYSGDYQYSIGQPMGALSSWAMLDLTHHFLVQLAAWKSGKTPVGCIYENYAILGDDLVIGDKEVYLAYLQLLEDLGMPVNLSKSIISEKGTALEFAKRTIWNGVDVSPITVKDIDSAQHGVPMLVQFMRNHKLTFNRLLSGLLFGWRVRSQLDKPIGQWNSQVRAIYLAINIPKSADEARAFFQIGATRNPAFSHAIGKIRDQFAKLERDGLRNRLMRLERQFSSYKYVWMELPRAMHYAWFNLQAILAYQVAERKGGSQPFMSWRPAYNQSNLFTFMKFMKSLLEQLWTGYASDIVKDIHAILVDLPNSPDFYEMYAGLIVSLREYSKIGLHHFSLERPVGAEGAESQRMITPQQIRFYRAWSGIIQNSLPLDALFKARPIKDLKPLIVREGDIIWVDPKGGAWVVPKLFSSDDTD